MAAERLVGKESRLRDARAVGDAQLIVWKQDFNLLHQLCSGARVQRRNLASLSKRQTSVGASIKYRAVAPDITRVVPGMRFGRLGGKYSISHLFFRKIFVRSLGGLAA